MIKSILLFALCTIHSIAYCDDNDARMHLELGKKEGAKNNHEKAIEHFKNCAQAFTGCGHNVGVSYEKLNQPENAIPWYTLSARMGLKESKDRLKILNAPIPESDLLKNGMPGTSGSDPKLTSKNNKSYKGLAGAEYQYDLSKPSDMIRYEQDLKAQLRDEGSISVRRELDRDLGRIGGGIYD